MQKQLLLPAIKSSLLFVAILLVQHSDEVGRGGMALSPAYLGITALLGMTFAVLLYQYHLWRYAKNPRYQAEWLHSPLMYISLLVLLLVITVWRG